MIFIVMKIQCRVSLFYYNCFIFICKLNNFIPFLSVLITFMFGQGSIPLSTFPQSLFGLVFIQSGSTPWGTKFITVMYTVQCTIYYRLNFFQVFLILITTLLRNYNYQAKTLDIKKALWGSTTFYFFTKQLWTPDF